MIEAKHPSSQHASLCVDGLNTPVLQTVDGLEVLFPHLSDIEAMFESAIVK